MNWIWLTLISAFAFASADAAIKHFFSEEDVWDATIVRFVFTGMMMAPWVAAHALPPLDPKFWIWVLSLAPLDVLALLLYVRAITIAPLSHTLPYLAFTPVFSALSSFILLGEEVSTRGFSGIALVTIGAYLLNNDLTGGGRDLFAPFKFIVIETGPRLMLCVAMIFSLTSTLGKGALQYMPGVYFGPFYALFLAVLIWILVLGMRRSAFTVVRRCPLGALLVGGAMGLMIITHFVAIQTVEVAYMIAVKRMSLLFGLVYGAWLFAERRLAQNLFAGTIMLGGVALIVMP
jgi:drug/metabolite transporter (DMT)-like permease